MKGVPRSFRTSASLIAALFLGVFVFLPVMAAPGGNPPLANVDANFNSVLTGAITSGTATLGDLSIDASGNLSKITGTSVMVANTNGLSIANALGVIGLNIQGDGTLVNPSTAGGPNNGFVKIIDTDGFAIAADATTLNSFTVAGDGTLSNPGVTNNGTVQVGDNDGFSVATGTGAGSIGLTIQGDGTLINPSVGMGPNNGVVKILDVDGFAIAPDVTSQNSFAVSGTGGISNVSPLRNGTVQVSDDDGFSVATSTGLIGLKIAANGNITNTSGTLTIGNNITSTGHVKATGGYGGFVRRSVSLPIAAGGIATVAAPCLGAERPISCGYTTAAPWGTFQINKLYTNTNTNPRQCEVYAKNTSGLSQTLTAEALCFDPNGNW